MLAALRQQARLLVGEVAGPLRRIQISRGDAAVEIEWHGDHNGGPARPAAVPPAAPVTATAPADVPQAMAGPGSGSAVSHSIVSPMVGTFYRAPEPGATPFVAVGDLVEPDRVIGIVEAMKLMNEITAGQAGRVLDVLVDDGQPVEFGQALIALAPA
ncbi:acetyl-CoA carboxylase biotin carboxyl carrier protein subunit [Rugosimonospora africana]|uniref:Biotin carboxyl carrier protein of acetyl-CoA carboxylase n=1 Tax=Rugosimonospora africana TaxID=556532 RepID=A0A8J3QYH2_9ACTN|nr:acetyl-CoA carboxylase biotin carboxyl carrier protein subunit [Rugosimonospora africana]